MKLLNPLQKYIENLDTVCISEERKTILQPLVEYIQSKSASKEKIQLNFICTHNSRRSHLAQVWAQTMAAYFNIPKIDCFSGGTETTAVYPSIIQSLEDTGFDVLIQTQGENPHYKIIYTSENDSILAFSKKYDDVFNPQNSFAAIMTCSQADAGCPFVAGAATRIAITFEDPKISDDTDKQKEVYAARSKQIATEMKYVFSKINL